MKKRIVIIILIILLLGSIILFCNSTFFKTIININWSIKNASVGDVIEFGEYEQDNVLSNGKEAVEWIIIDKKPDKVLVISKNALDYLPFDDQNSHSTWETSQIRKWLNSDFLTNCFNKYEMDYIDDTTVIAHDNLKFNIDAGNDTEDEIFLLSIDESEALTTVDSRNFVATEYSENKCLEMNGNNSDEEYSSDDGYDYRSWLLRTPGQTESFVAVVSPKEDIKYYGDFGILGGNKDLSYFIRPAMLIKY